VDIRATGVEAEPNRSGNDGTVRLWEVATGHEVQNFKHNVARKIELTEEYEDKHLLDG
jgi:hypothetical protein